MTRPATDSEGAGQKSPSLAIGVTGCTGRVAKLVIHELQSHHFGAHVSLAGGTVRPGLPPMDEFFTTEDPDALFERADVVIDFTTPDATARHVWLAAKHKKPLVIGTTGLNEAHEKEIADAALETPIVYAANMSIGVTILCALVEKVATIMGEDYDIEIMETHHKHKVDAPSGTALALGKAAANGRRGHPADGKDTPENIFSRHGQTGARPDGAIGYAVQRGGDVVGDHGVSFFGEGERLMLGHMATDRRLFAKGAIRAALWVKDRSAGLYTMRDVLDL